VAEEGERVSNHVFRKAIRALRVPAARLGRQVVSAFRVLAARLKKEGSPALKRWAGLLLWAARLIVELWVRSRW
jgi:hypothetical protein